ncbi:hypothetical protein RIR_e50209_A0A2N1NYN7_9GLOM [Rhizophagus irregularis DAOM 181602=DAOM 197198]|uniref:Uncharacterized protein n=1 Tax=Rhizophagus irregularis TaxID=588596 RepID=A0A2N1NYN7_9GLOM|nr:hypothetical protein RhiirC2_468984 [Rhizophagus irregularis]GET50238.1 hypothetical protein RIR_e50209_A0A2N1NYN7_9GLOM [Rhizophagus irregularis DAOM 181602=DAOM 197198]
MCISKLAVRLRNNYMWLFLFGLIVFIIEHCLYKITDYLLYVLDFTRIQCFVHMRIMCMISVN